MLPEADRLIQAQNSFAQRADRVVRPYKVSMIGRACTDE